MTFTDFQKAFDSVIREKLCTISLRGRMYNTIKGIYNGVKAKVKVGDVTFLCSRGLKQEEICSPVFTVY